MSAPNNFNQNVIERFRQNSGKVSGWGRLLLLTTTGAKSGRTYTTPVMYLADGERLVVFASKGGAPTNPAWYHNLVANPAATVEVGEDSFPVQATVTSGEDRERLFSRQAQAYPQFADYEQKTTRQIPVVALQRAG